MAKYIVFKVNPFGYGELYGVGQVTSEGPRVTTVQVKKIQHSCFIEPDQHLIVSNKMIVQTWATQKTAEFAFQYITKGK